MIVNKFTHLIVLCFGAAFLCSSCVDEMKDVIPDVPYFEYVANLEAPQFTPLKETHHAVYVGYAGYAPPGATQGHGFYIFRYLEGFTAFDATCPATADCMTSPYCTTQYDGSPKTTITCRKCGAQYDLIYGGPVKGSKNRLKQYKAFRVAGSTFLVRVSSQ